MADKDDEFLDSDEGGESGGQKEGGKGGNPFASAMILQILKWAAIIVGFLILVVTVSVIVFNVLGGANKQNEDMVESPEYSTAPLDGDWYNEIPEFRGETNDENNRSMYVIKIHIMYPTGDRELQNQLIRRTIQIQDQLLTWFSRQNSGYLREIENRESIRETIKQQINKMLPRAVTDIRFTKFEILSL